VSDTYFKTAHAAILEIGVKLAHVLWRKIKPDDLKNADTSLIHITFDMLTEERYAIACTLLDFAAEVIKKYASEESRRIFIVNRAQAYKWSGNQEKARQIMMGEDWSASSDVFRLAEATLLRNFKAAANLVRRIGTDGYLISGTGPESTYRDWPLFREFRQSPEFLEAFESVFGKPFTTEFSVGWLEQEMDDATTNIVLQHTQGGQDTDALPATEAK
jgi:hypothetical protein